MKALGIKLKDKIIFYHVGGSMWSSRAMWMLKAYGHKNVFVLNGGLKKWLEEGREVEADSEETEEEQYSYRLQTDVAMNFESISERLREKEY